MASGSREIPLATMTASAGREILPLLLSQVEEKHRMLITRNQARREETQRETVSAHTRTARDHPKSCGHLVHVGTCAACQRVQLTRWREQLAQASCAL